MAVDTEHGTADADAGTTSDDAGSGPLPLGVTLSSAAVAAAVTFPLLWLVLAAADVGGGRAVGLLTRETTVGVMTNSALAVALVTGLSIVLAVPLAYLTVRTTLPFRRFWTIAVTLPLVIPSYIGAFSFASAFGPRGEFGTLLAPLGVESVPTVDGLEGTVLILTLYTYPYVYITTRAALKTLDTTLIDAARTLGHGRLGTFRRVVVPQIRPAVAAGSLLVALYALSDFGTPAIMRYQVFTTVIYTEQRLGAFGQEGLAPLLSLQLLAITVVILAVESRIRGEDTLHTGRQGGRTGATIRLGRWRWVAMLLPATVATLALAVPLGIFGLWLVRGTESIGQGLAFQPEYAVNSVAVSAAAALVATLAALPIAYLSARHDGRLPALFERLSYVGYAVPGVVMGLALVYFGARFATPLYQTLPLLVFAYVVRFLPQSVGSTRASFLQVNPALPEAARTLGRSSLSAFRSITMPLIAPGLLGGAALVFLTTMKELPATLLLHPTGFKTLVLHIWQVHRSGHFGHAAVPALVLLAVSGLSILVIVSQEGYDVK